MVSAGRVVGQRESRGRTIESKKAGLRGMRTGSDSAPRVTMGYE